MEFRALIAKALLTGAKSTEVFRGPGDHIVVEFEVDAALLVCEEVSEEILKLCGHQWYLQSTVNADVGEGGAIDLTFDLISGMVLMVHDRSLPGDVEVGLYCHCCVRSAEMVE